MATQVDIVRKNSRLPPTGRRMQPIVYYSGEQVGDTG